MENVFSKSFVNTVTAEIKRQYEHEAASEKPASVTRSTVLTALYPEAGPETLAALESAVNGALALGLVPFKSVQKKGFVPLNYKSSKDTREAELRRELEAKIRAEHGLPPVEVEAPTEAASPKRRSRKAA